MEFLSYDIKNGTHRTAEAEWAPHEPKGLKFFEWQYFTAPLLGDNGHRYFLLYCVFNFGGTIMRTALSQNEGKVPKDKMPMVSIVHICDCDGNVYKTSNGLNLVPRDELFDNATGTLHIPAGEKLDIEKEILDALKVKKEVIVLEKAFAIGKRTQ